MPKTTSPAAKTPAAKTRGAGAPRKPAAKKAPAVRKTPRVVAESLPEPAPKQPKNKLVRDSFTIPKAEYAVIDALKRRAAGLTHVAKKSELLRAGIKSLAAMSDRDFLAAVQAVPAIKTGRPKSGKTIKAD